VTGPPPDHDCWWKDLAEGLAATLAELDNESSTSALRQMLRAEQERRRKAERRVAEVEHLLEGEGLI
jgi:hypothetical protein